MQAVAPRPGHELAGHQGHPAGRICHRAHTWWGHPPRPACRTLLRCSCHLTASLLLLHCACWGSGLYVAMTVQCTCVQGGGPRPLPSGTTRCSGWCPYCLSSWNSLSRWGWWGLLSFQVGLVGGPFFPGGAGGGSFLSRWGWWGVSCSGSGGGLPAQQRRRRQGVQFPAAAPPPPGGSISCSSAAARGFIFEQRSLSHTIGRG